MILVVKGLKIKPCKARAAWLLSLFCLCTSLLLAGCEAKPKFETVLLAGSTMGTTYSIKLAVPAEQKAAAIKMQPAIDQLLKEFNQSLSTYINDSELMTINSAPAGEWLSVSPRFMAVLSLSQEISELSHGAFDVTVGPLVNLWGFGPDWHEDKAPSDQQIAEVMVNVGYGNILIDKDPLRIQKTKPVRMDFSAVAKGYGVDEVADYLWQQGFHHFMVEIGGELRLHGHNALGEAWRIGVESPKAGGKIQPIVVSEAGMATSGDYRNYFEQNGIRFSHTIDPATGKPVTHSLASVTVIAATSAKADALATAFSVLGGSKSLALAEEQGIAIYIIERIPEGFTARHSSAFTPYLHN